MENTITRNIKRGQIYFAEIPDTIGSVYRKTRPVLIVSNDKNNYYSKTVTACPLTTRTFRANMKKDLPTHVYIGCVGNLTRNSTVMCENVSNYSVEILRECVAELSQQKMKEVEHALMIQIALV